MIGRLVERLRIREFDRQRAWRAARLDADRAAAIENFDRDAVIGAIRQVAAPAILIGTMKNVGGERVPLRLAKKEFATHWLVQGGTGTGKTSFVTWAVRSAVGLRCPVGVVDCKSGFFDVILRSIGAYAYGLDPDVRAEFVQSLAVVNPFGSTLVPLNVCKVLKGWTAEVQAYEVSLTFSRLFDTGLSTHMENLLRHLLMLLMEHELSLVEAPWVLQDEVLRGVLVERSKNETLKEFFFRTYAAMPNSSKDSLTTRLQALLLPENLRLMLGADDVIDFRSILDRGAPLVAFLGKGPGVPEEQVDVLGSLLLQLLFQGAYASDSNVRRPYQIFLDEFFHLLEAPALARRFETGLTTLRSFGVTLALVMHNFSQVPPTLRETLLANVDLVALFRTSARNAQFFGEFLPTNDPAITAKILSSTGHAPNPNAMRSHLMEQLQRLPNRHLYWYDRRKPYRAVLVKVPMVKEPHEAVGISASELERFINEQGIRSGGWAVSKDVLRKQVEARRQRIQSILRPPVEMRGVEVDETTGVDLDKKASKGRRRARLG